MPVWQLRVLQGYRLGIVFDHIFRRQVKLKLWIDGRLCDFIVTVLQVGCPPVNELDHVVPDFLHYKLEVKAALELLKLSIALNLVIDVHLLIYGALRDINHLERFITDERVEEESTRVPNFDVQVLFHQLKVAGLVLHLDLCLEVFAQSCVKVGHLLCHLRDALGALGQVSVL